jgi:hypothetical protein
MQAARGLATFVAVVSLIGLASSARAQTTTIRVNCAKRQSINKALEFSARELSVDISGTCQEAVVVKRSGVTLRGTDPFVDGIQAPAGAGSALALQYALEVRVENLTISGGSEAALLAEHSSASVTNCRIADSPALGLSATHSNLEVTDTALTQNGTAGAVQSYGMTRYTRSSLTDNHRASDCGGGLAVAYGHVSLWDSSVTDCNPVNVLRSRFESNNSNVISDGSQQNALQAEFGSFVRFRGGDIVGSVWAGSGHLSVLGVQQTADAAGWSGIHVGGGGHLAVHPGVETPSTLHGDISLSAFATRPSAGNTRGRQPRLLVRATPGVPSRRVSSARRTAALPKR